MNETWLRDERAERAARRSLRAYAVAAGVLLAGVLLAASMGGLR